MSFDWPLSTLDDFVSLFTGFPFKSKQFSDVEGTKLLRGDNVAQGTLRWENVKRWTDENVVDKHKNYLLRENDVILAMDRPWIEAGLKFSQIESRDLPCYLVQRVACLRANDPDDQDFLKFVIGSRAFTEYVKLVQTGTAVPHISGKQILAFEFRLPPKDVRLLIGKILSDIDKKVSINTQTNQTLEQMAQVIFKSWFVDFDPVKAKMRGEQPEGMDAATVSLFPEKLVESELGFIPEGWEPKQLKDILELAYGKALKKTDRVEGDIPVYGSGGLTGYHNQSLVEGPGIIVGRKGTVGSVYWEPKAFYPIDTVFYVKPQAGYSLNYCYLILQNLGLKDMNTDAAVPGLNRNNAYRLEVVTPSLDVLNKFESLMHSFQSKIDGNNSENSNLETLRDTLLPKLLSGEIELESVATE